MGGHGEDSTPTPPDINEDYEVGETLGTGHFSKVKLGTHRKTGQKVAIKIINKPTGSKISMLKTEVDILTKADHPNVVKLYKVLDTPNILYLVMELLTGGELFDRIIAKGHYSENDARKLTVTMLKAVKYLHDLGIAHRDLKPENILLKDTSEEAEIKITDFGLSKIFSDDVAGEVVMKTACGTPGYVAPEVLMHENYSSQVDLWSIGVIVYILLCGFPPFYGDNDNQMFRKIKAGQYKFLSPYWDPISQDAKDFVSKLLVVDCNKRMDCATALKHKWLAGTTEVSTRNLFEGMAKNSERDGIDNEPEAGGRSSEVTVDKQDMHSMFVDFNLDRKASGMEQLRRVFDLPETSVRLKKFKCALGSQPGQLHVTTNHLCFLGGLGGKKLTVPLDKVKTISKAKRFKFSPGAGHSIKVVVDDTTHMFNGFMQREEAFALMVDLAKKAGAKLTTD
uniref:Protein kinase domain-containing protein n=1 Tax=Chrysotila carterae TaxID=13221 RepID=A0A6S9XZE7_CHRCT|mmetsp:Transcript_17688/g.38173  ORF Transcript_17688/g.38173 Transcript_17688/m.38173 type:complete len:451 (+) Transcript_17688:175-1527(+)